MGNKLSLGDRMKNYEAVPKNFLMRRNPCILRLDMKAGHSFTKGFERPYDQVFKEAMDRTMLRLCKGIQGCVFGYSQSDEITLVLIDYQKLTTDAWFQYNVQKMTSVAASMATKFFDDEFKFSNVNWIEHLKTERSEMNEGIYIEGTLTSQERAVAKTHGEAITNKLALFDCRAFSLPKEEVANCIIWRQQDAIRNSKQMWGQTYFSHKEIEGKNTDKLVKMVYEKTGLSWYSLKEKYKHGTACYRREEYRYDVIDVEEMNGELAKATRNVWYLDENMHYIAEFPDFVNKHIYISQED